MVLDQSMYQSIQNPSSPGVFSVAAAAIATIASVPADAAVAAAATPAMTRAKDVPLAPSAGLDLSTDQTGSKKGYNRVPKSKLAEIPFAKNIRILFLPKDPNS